MINDGAICPPAFSTVRVVTWSFSLLLAMSLSGFPFFVKTDDKKKLFRSYSTIFSEITVLYQSYRPKTPRPQIMRVFFLQTQASTLALVTYFDFFVWSIILKGYLVSLSCINFSTEYNRLLFLTGNPPSAVCTIHFTSFVVISLSNMRHLIECFLIFF